MNLDVKPKTRTGWKTILRKLVKNCKIDGGYYCLVLWKESSLMLTVITRNSNVDRISKDLQGYAFWNVDRDIQSVIRRMMMFGMFYSMDYFNRQDRVLVDCLFAIEKISRSKDDSVGLMFNTLCKNVDAEPEEVVKAVDFLIRSGIVVKLVTGGLWTRKAYWKLACKLGQAYWSSPGFIVRNGKMVCKRKMYGKYARKNFVPGPMGVA
jgi:hypothetical protein